MSSGLSPQDPIFFLHHNMVDRLWQIWEDQNTSIQRNFFTGNIAMHGYDSTDANHTYPCDIVANNQTDSRSITRPVSGGGCSTTRNWDVWFAYQGGVILDGANGSPFVCADTTEPYLYRYTAAITPGSNIINGTMYVGDIKRQTNFSTVIQADNKGGFEINNGVVCNFKVGNTVVFMSGFHAKSGSIVVAKIIIEPNASRVINTSTVYDQDDLKTIKEKTIIISPNPNNGIFTINLNTISDGKIQITDLYGFPVFTQTIKNQKEISINMQEKSKGIYIVKIIVADQIITAKIIKN